MSRYSNIPSSPNQVPRTAAYNASDVISRYQKRNIFVFKTQNEFDKQHGLTIRGVVNGNPGAQPIPYGIIPSMAESSQSLSVSEYTLLNNNIIDEYNRNNASDASGGGGTGGLPMNIYYISGNNGGSVTANAVNSSTAPASVTILANGSFGSEQDTYGGEDFYFTFTLPSVIPTNGGIVKVGLQSRTSPTGYDLYVIIGTSGVNRLVVFTNGDTTFTAVGGHTYHMRYVQSTTPATLSLYDATTSTVVVAPRNVPLKLTDYYIFLEGNNTGVGSVPYVPITITGIDIQPYTP